MPRLALEAWRAGSPGLRGERFVTIRKVIDDIDDEESSA
jgi:hypothetical protein